MHKKRILHWLWEVLNDLIGHSYFCDLKNKQHIYSPASRRGRDRGSKANSWRPWNCLPSILVSNLNFHPAANFHTLSLCLPRRKQRKVKANLKCINNAVVSESSLQVPMLQFCKHRNLGVRPAVNFTAGSSLWKGSVQKPSIQVLPTLEAFLFSS